eukprot:COSAG05_NODE_275_length_12406_cov_12.621841_18_plen_53_part_00
MDLQTRSRYVLKRRWYKQVDHRLFWIVSIQSIGNHVGTRALRDRFLLQGPKQ